MPVYKDEERGTWYVDFRYKDYAAKWQRKKKRGFKTQREAKAWEREFLSSIHTDKQLTFNRLFELYMDDCKPRQKKTTLKNKQYAFNKHILPFFGTMKLEDIKPQTVRQWQTELLNKEYMNSSVAKLHTQLSAVFNFAIKFHGLEQNPARDCGNVGNAKSSIMQFWMVSEFKQFSEAIKEKSPPCYVMFSLMFWSGIRCGEAMALTASDFDFAKRTLRINKTFSVVDGEHLITPPKTRKSKRTIDIPDFVCDLIKEYIGKQYGLKPDSRLFPLAHRTTLYHFDNAIDAAGIKKIRIHDLRHSHASMLINNNVPILYISERLGHESVKVTLDVYSHLYPENKAAVMELLTSLNAG